MSNTDEKYLSLLDLVLLYGEDRETRSGHTLSLFSPQNIEWDVRMGFPILSAREISFKNIAHELLWFMGSIPPWYTSTNIKYLVDNNVNIWNADAFRNFTNKYPANNLTQKEYILMISHHEDELPEGDLGNIYGKFWGKQLGNVIHQIQNNRNSRRLVVASWEEDHTLPVPKKSALPPCHYSFQFFVDHLGRLSLKWTQRSVDVMLGLPYNIASYATLLHIVGHLTGYKPYRLIFSGGDVHVYKDHVEKAKELLKRTAASSSKPMLEIVGNPLNHKSVVIENLHLTNYNPHPKMEIPLLVG